MQKKVLIAVGLLTVALLTVSFFVFDPFKTFAKMRNDRRQADMQLYIDSVKKYSKENRGAIPKGIPVSNDCTEAKNIICKSDKDCKGANLSILTKDGKYLENLKDDPKNTSKESTGYHISQNDKGRITVCAPMAEMDKKLSIVY